MSPFSWILKWGDDFERENEGTRNYYLVTNSLPESASAIVVNLCVLFLPSTCFGHGALEWRHEKQHFEECGFMYVQNT